MKFINYNGNIQSSDQPVFTINNRAFRYGDALFETIRVINGRPHFLSDHMERLLEGMAALMMEVPDYFSVDFFTDQINDLLKKADITQGGRLRLTVFRKNGGFYTPETNEVNWVIEAMPLEDNLFVLNKDGYNIDLYEDHRKPIHKLSGVKSNNCLTYVLAGLYKKEKRLDECVLMNELGSISECISSNIFVAYNGVLYTPSVNQGIIPGVMRKKIIELAHQNKIEVQECPLNPQVLLRADELFLTNSINGIRWVGAYRSKRYFNKVSKFLTEKLNDHVANLALDPQGSSI